MNLHYPGDCTRIIKGRIVGPTTYGERLVITEASYDPETRLTTAKLAYASTKDIENEVEVRRGAVRSR
jgi:hypothetical protein